MGLVYRWCRLIRTVYLDAKLPITKAVSFNRKHSPRRVGLILEQLESRLALSNDAPFVIAMVSHDDDQVSLQMSEDVVNLDIGDFELLQDNYAIDLSMASIRAVTLRTIHISYPH